MQKTKQVYILVIHCFIVICECVFCEDLIITALYWLMSGITTRVHHMVSSNLFCALLSKHAVFFKLSFHRQGVFINAVTCSWPTILLTCFFNTVKLKKKKCVITICTEICLFFSLKNMCCKLQHTVYWKKCQSNYKLYFQN